MSQGRNPAPSPDLTIRRLTIDDRDVAVAVINTAARWYREFLPAEELHDPEMTPAQWEAESRRLTWYGAFSGSRLIGVMGLEYVRDVALLRHAYILPEEQHHGVGGLLREHLVTSLVGRQRAPTEDVARKFGVPHVATDLAESLARSDVDAVILATPTQMHAAQAIACMEAGKHVQVEIPLADRLADAEAVVAKQRATGLVAMAGHTRRFNPSHQWVHRRIERGEFRVQQMDVQTYFFRRKNMNALGQPRSWTDHLLWHHAAHTVDLFAWQAGEIVDAHAMQGPPHPELGIGGEAEAIENLPDRLSRMDCGYDPHSAAA